MLLLVSFPSIVHLMVVECLLVGFNICLGLQAMVNVQMLSELEEVIQYKLVPERQEAIHSMWWFRLQGCQRVVEDWQRIIQVGSSQKVLL